MLSKSRIMTAIWARLAASATRVKSLRKTSVEADLAVTGFGGASLAEGDCWADDCADDVELRWWEADDARWASMFDDDGVGERVVFFLFV